MITYGQGAFDSFIATFEIEAATVLREMFIISGLGRMGVEVGILSASLVEKHMTSPLPIIHSDTLFMTAAPLPPIKVYRCHLVIFIPF